MGVVPEKQKLAPVIIHEDRPFNPWPLAAAVLVIFVMGVLLFERRRNSEALDALAQNNRDTLVVNNHSPLFQSPSSGSPKLVQVTSLAGAAPTSSKQSKPSSAEPSAASDDPLDDSSDDLISAPTNAGPESVQLSDVQLASQNDGDGHEMAMGTATIYNPSAYEVTTYDLYLATGGGSYRLEPFSGSAEHPVAVQNKTIPPGGRITVPIMSNGVYTVTDPSAAKTVTVEAVENGVTVSSHVMVN